jgi:transposase
VWDAVCPSYHIVPELGDRFTRTLSSNRELKAVGVDEWAWQRGHHYGTILVNLETHRVADVLPERSADTMAQWLAQHPSIEVVSRDRSGLYAHGIAQGVPKAVQVVDRFHLVANLREALEAVFLARPAVLQEAAARTAQAITQSVAAAPVTSMYRGRRHRPQNWQHRQESERQRRHACGSRRHIALENQVELMFKGSIPTGVNFNQF